MGGDARRPAAAGRADGACAAVGRKIYWFGGYDEFGGWGAAPSPATMAQLFRGQSDLVSEASAIDLDLVAGSTSVAALAAAGGGLAVDPQ